MPSTTVAGVLCGTGAALFWAAGLVAAKHGIQAGLSPTDIAFHRFTWAGLALLPFVLRDHPADLGGIGWMRGGVLALLAGPLLAILSYLGLAFAPFGHGAVVQPATAMLVGLMMATWLLREPLSRRRSLGALAILAGLLLLAAEAVTTIGHRGVTGDLMFITAGAAWATFGTLLRHWRLAGLRAAMVVSALSLLYAPVHAAVFGFDRMIAVGLPLNLLQILVQGVFAGAGAIYLFTRAVALLGAGRAASFPALVPAMTLLLGFLFLGEVPTLVQLAGLAAVFIGFRLAL
jgi:drug/metabolite transporter (DMT)-like permease